jgi:hypothetical protein
MAQEVWDIRPTFVKLCIFVVISGIIIKVKSVVLPNSLGMIKNCLHCHC